MAIVTLGIDLAKNVFALHGVDATGKAVLLRPSVPRGKLREVVASLPACLIGMEACSGAHHIEQIARESATARQLMQLPGVGATTATALVSMIGRGQEFRCGRQLSAWLGLVPGQYSSGSKQRLGRITKAGDPYLRMLLILGARSVLQSAKDKSDVVSRWAVQLAVRVGYWKAIVAIAAKNARMCWAVLRRGEGLGVTACCGRTL